MPRVGIITWGEDGERVISLASAAHVEKSLRNFSAAELLIYDMPRDRKHLEADLEGQVLDFAFVMMHGKGGEDGELLWLLDLYQTNYQCASREVLALTINKRATKELWRQAGLPVAKDMLISPQDISLEHMLQSIEKKIGFPCVWKMLAQWSSNGIHIIADAQELEEISALYPYITEPILIEAYLVGDEVTVGILEQADWTPLSLPVTLIIPPVDSRFDFANKYNGLTQELCPAPLDRQLQESCQQIALMAYKAVGCSKYARVDMIITSDWPILLEINTIPGFTEQSLFPKAAQVAWFPFPKLLEHLMMVGSTSHCK